jgi:GNAT superfamily N-acetyltransferase
MKIIDYSPELDEKLINFFYYSLFSVRKEFEYIRSSDSWISRYNNYDYIIKIALSEDNDIIGTLGLIMHSAFNSDTKFNVGCFLDNCIDPKLDNPDEVILSLFKEVEKVALNKKIKIIYGWDYKHNLSKNKVLLDENGYSYIDGVNWFPSNISFKNYHSAWKKTSLNWKIIFKLMGVYEKINELLLPKLDLNIQINEVSNTDVNDIIKFINDQPFSLRSNYSNNELSTLFDQGIIDCIIAKNGNGIIGVLTFFRSSWGGWMFGRPTLDENYGVFKGITPDEFYVHPDYQNSGLASRMLLKLRYLGGNYNFIADVFDRRITWRMNALKKIGCIEPDFDYGVYIYKKLDDNISITIEKPWILPAKYILDPIITK